MSTLPPPPPAPPAAPRGGITGFWQRRSTKGKVASATAIVIALAVAANPAPDTPSRAADFAAIPPESSTATTAAPRATPAPTSRPTGTPIATPTPTPRPTPTPTPSPTIAPADRLFLISDAIYVGDDRESFEGTQGTYTWDSVTLDTEETRVGWKVSAGSSACQIRWIITPETEDVISRTVKVAARDEQKSSRRLDTYYLGDVDFEVRSTCPKWQVTMMEAPEPTPTPRPKAANCHPSYKGQCLDPNASDYDCAWGSGNGPKYVEGTVDVVGWDEYDLDRDNDGIGCERS